MKKVQPDATQSHLPPIAAVAPVSAITAVTTSATATASATATTMAATTTAVTATTAAPTAAAFSLRPCFVHDEIASSKILAVHGVDRAIGFFVISNFNEGETA
jgi:hypothetical protein